MVEVCVHILYCNLNPPEHFRLSYRVKSFWCPSSITVSDGVGPDDEKEVKYIKLPVLPLKEYQEFLEKKSEEIPTVSIKVVYTPVGNEHLNSIEVGLASLKMYADMVYQNRPTWKWLSIKSQWNEKVQKVCGKIFIQLSVKITAAPLLKQVEQVMAASETDKVEEAKLIDDHCENGSDASSLTLENLGSPFAETNDSPASADVSNSVRTSTPTRDAVSSGRSEGRTRPSSLIKPICLTPFPRGEVTGRRSFDSSVAVTTNVTTTALPSALVHHDNKISKPKKTVSFRIKSLSRRSSRTRHSLLPNDAERKGSTSKIPVPIHTTSSRNTHPQLNTTMPI